MGPFQGRGCDEKTTARFGDGRVARGGMWGRVRGRRARARDHAHDTLLPDTGDHSQGEAHECPGNADQPVAIELSGPIGDRQLVDGLALGVSLEHILQSKAG